MYPGDDFMEEYAENSEEDRIPGRVELVKKLNTEEWDWDIISELRYCFSIWYCFSLVDGNN